MSIYPTYLFLLEYSFGDWDSVGGKQGGKGRNLLKTTLGPPQNNIFFKIVGCPKGTGISLFLILGSSSGYLFHGGNPAKVST